MTHPFVILDIDGTVCENGARIDWQNPVSVYRLSRALPKAQARVRAMVAEGWEPFFLTARHESCGTVTMKHLREWFGNAVADAADLALCPVSFAGLSRVEMRNEIVAHKAAWLREVSWDGVGVYVGDSLWDKQAAELAGWRFMWAHDWLAGQPFFLDGQAMPLLGVV